MKIFGQWSMMAAHEECVLVVAVGTWGGKAGQRLETGRPVRKEAGRPEMGDGSEMRKELTQKEGLAQSAISEKEQLTPADFQGSDTCGRSLEGGEELCRRGAEFEVWHPPDRWGLCAPEVCRG